MLVVHATIIAYAATASAVSAAAEVNIAAAAGDTYADLWPRLTVLMV